MAGRARYRIEYLTGTAGRTFVCNTAFSDSSLAAAVLQARVGAAVARVLYRANGFQVRDDFQRAHIVAHELFWGFDALASGESHRLDASRSTWEKLDAKDVST